MRPFFNQSNLLLAALVYSSLAHAASADTSTVAQTTDIAPGVVNLDLIFPLNNTYAPFDGAMPIVFALSRPDIASVLQLQLSYLLSEQSNSGVVFGNSQVFNLSSGPIPPTNDNSDGEYTFFVHFSNDSITGRVGQFRMELIFIFIVDYPGDAKVPNTLLQVPLMYDMFFTTQTGAQAAIVPGMEAKTTNSTNSTSTCMPLGRESFYFPINITGFITENGTDYGVISTDRSSNNLPRCAIEVDSDTAATIVAGPTTASASPTANVAISVLAPNSFTTVTVMAVSLFIALLGGALLI